MDNSRRAATKYLNRENTHAVMNSKLIENVVYVNKKLDQVQLAKTHPEHKGPIMVWFFIFQ